MPVWLQNEGAWIAIGVSVLFVVAGVVMHQVIMRVLKQGDPSAEQPHSTQGAPVAPSTEPDHEQQP